MSLQDPEFDKFKRAFKEENFEYALHSLKKLLAQYPQSVALCWHHVKVLEKLEHFAEARTALNNLLELRNDFVPALIMQVQLDFHEYDLDDDNDFENDAIKKQQAHFDTIEQRLYKILRIDPNAVDALHMLSGLLRGHEGDVHLAKANQFLNRAINLAPERVDLLEDRANSFLAHSLEHDDESHSDKNIVTTFSGMRYERHILEQALADFQLCYLFSNQHRYGLRVGSILHDLGRFDEALVTYDQILAKVPVDDPHRHFIIERRAYSENNGAGEREHTAKTIEAAIAHSGKDRTLDEDAIAHTLLSAANAVRKGKPVNDALAERLSDDPDNIIVTSIAAQILNVANEPPPALAKVEPQDFPVYQQKFIAECKRDLAPLGLYHISDAEAQGLSLLLGQRILLSFFSDEFGEMGVACFCMQPKKPNLLGFLLLLLTGKWKTTKMVECVSQFNNGDLLSTQYESPSPFEYGSPIFIKKLPATSPVSELVSLHLERLAEYIREHANAFAMRALDLEAMEQRWVEGQKIKHDYRAKIGYITDEELQKLLGTHYEKLAQKVRERINILAADL